MHSWSFVLAMLVGWGPIAQAQQFFKPNTQSYDVLGLSDACVQVLNTELQHCHHLLFERTDRSTSNSVKVLPRKELEQICQLGCREELKELRVKIVETCTAPQDVIHHAGTVYPPFYFVDKFAYTFDINCYKDKASDRFCDELRSEWKNGSVEFDKCHECNLGPLAAMISSPLGVTQSRVDKFKQTKAACKDTAFEPVIATTYMKPEDSAMRLASAGETDDTRKCERWYTMREGDKCDDISRSQRTSTLSLIQKNAIDINCAMMPEAGTKLCLDKPCDIHTIVPGDTCASIARKYSISESQFRSLNEIIDEKCSNIARWEGYVTCVGPRSLFAGSAQSGRFPEFGNMQSNSTIPMTAQKPLAPGSSAKCNMFVNGRALTDPDLVGLWGDNELLMNDDNIRLINRCSYVTRLNNVDMNDFIKLNPSLVVGGEEGKRSKCQLEGKYSYCLAEGGGPKPVLDEGWNRRLALRWG